MEQLIKEDPKEARRPLVVKVICPGCRVAHTVSRLADMIGCGACGTTFAASANLEGKQ